MLLLSHRRFVAAFALTLAIVSLIACSLTTTLPPEPVPPKVYAAAPSSTLCLSDWAPEPPAQVSASIVEESQADFPPPSTNSGAFLHSIPLPVPEGINGLGPQVEVAYSSRGGVGICGVGWDLPAPVITLNLADGFRPRSLEEDLARYAPNVPVERYASHFGTIAVLKSVEDYDAATKTFLFNPNNDCKIAPRTDIEGREDIYGEAACFEVTRRDGTVYRYGFYDYSSLYQAESSGNERKVAWYLDNVEDVWGNMMRYYWHVYPGEVDTYRQPVLRAIEYGLPASNDDATKAIVVLFDYTESPWKRCSYAHGTRMDFAYLLSKISVYTRTHMVQYTADNGSTHFRADDVADDGTPSGDALLLHSYEFAYDFQTGSLADRSYSGRPLLVSVQTRAADGSVLPPWEFEYQHRGEGWAEPLSTALTNGDFSWFNLPEDRNLEYATHDVEEMSMDLNGDGLSDLIAGNPDGDFRVDLRHSTGSFTESGWSNPLAEHAEPMEIMAVPLTVRKDSPRSNCWYDFDYMLLWMPPVGGLGYTEALTSAPEDFWSIYHHSDSSGEYEDYKKTLGMFQFLHNSYYAPHPAIGKRNLVSAARTMDELETFGSYKDTREEEYAFDWRTCDCQDWWDKAEIDYCWEIGIGRMGSLGEDLQCLDYAGSRWFTGGEQDKSYSSELWSLMDINGDGLPDWVYAAPLIQRTAAGQTRDLHAGVNDWYVAFGTGQGWSEPTAWSVPEKDGAKLGISGIDYVHGTGLLSTAISTNDISAVKTNGITIGASVSFNGSVAIQPGVILAGRASSLPIAVKLQAGVAPTITMPGLKPDGSFSIVEMTKAVASAGAGAAQSYAVSQLASGLAHEIDVGNTSAARQSISSVVSAASIAEGLPEVGVEVDITNKGVRPHVYLPAIGDVFSRFYDEPTDTVSMQFQCLADMTGDGRPDLVSSRFDAGSGFNSAYVWLVCRNNGAGFDTPYLMRFDEKPVFAGLFDHTAISTVRTVSYTKNIWMPEHNWTKTLPYGRTEQYVGLADINGDGMLDFVDSFASIDDGEQVWGVYFNMGDQFSGRVDWKFEGAWDHSSGDCTGLASHATPRISQTVFGFVDYYNTGVANSRQVQGLLDVNADGLLDYWFEVPTPIGKDSEPCGYVADESNFGNVENLENRVSPYQLSGDIKVCLNTGYSFAEPVDWYDKSGAALSGTYMEISLSGEEPSKPESWVVTSVGDMNSDGVCDLAVRDEDVGSLFRLYPMVESAPDLLEQVRTPFGGYIEPRYSYHVEPGGEAAWGQWVVSWIRQRDFDTSRDGDGDGSILVRQYSYEHGKYSREHREFWGYERVYTYSPDSPGYSVSRFYQEKGLEGLLFCHEVRRLGSDQDAGETVLAQTTASAELWRAAGIAGQPAGYQTATAIGSATKDRSPVEPRREAEDSSAAYALAPSATESQGGPTADALDIYTGAVGPAFESAAEEADEAERAESDEATRFDVDTTQYESETDATGLHENFPPLDANAFDASGSVGPIGTVADRSSITSGMYDTFSGDGSTNGSIHYETDADEIIASGCECGQSADTGTPVRRMVYVYEDYSSLTGLYNPRMRLTLAYLFDSEGLNPRITAAKNEFDSYGNITLVHDYGDVAVAKDELTTETQYLTSLSANYIIDRPEHKIVKDACGQVLAESWFTYGSRGQLQTEEHAIDGPDTARTRYTYTDEGLVESIIGPLGNRKEMTYYSSYPWFKTAESESAPGHATRVTQWAYYGVSVNDGVHFGLEAFCSDPNGVITAKTYDAFGRPAAVVRPGDTVVAPSEWFTYRDWDTDGERLLPREVETAKRIAPGSTAKSTALLNGFGHEIAKRSNPPNNDTGCEGGDCQVIEYELLLDSAARESARRLAYFENQSAQDEVWQRTGFDLLGRTTRTTFPNGGEVRVNYDRELMISRDAGGQLTATFQDAFDNPVVLAEYTGGGSTLYRTTIRKYRPDGKLLQVTDTAGNQWTFEYDLLGRLRELTTPDTGTTRWVYDDAGNVLLVWDGRFDIAGRVLEMEYDAFGRVVRKTDWSGASVSGSAVSTGTREAEWRYYYDREPGAYAGATLTGGKPLGRVGRLEAYERRGPSLALVLVKEFCYDDRGRIEDKAVTIDGVTYAFGYSYNAMDEVTGISLPDGTEVGYSYDASGRRLTMTAGSEPLTTRIVRNAHGQPVRKIFDSGGAVQEMSYTEGVGTLPVLERQVTYSGMPKGDWDTAADSGWLHALEFGYNDQGLVTTRREGYLDPTTGEFRTVERTYAYDDLHRITSETSGETEYSIEYDELNNITSMGGATRGFGEAGRPVANAGPHGLLATSDGFKLTYDKAGNVLSISSDDVDLQYFWAAENRPVQVVRDGAGFERYSYDENGQVAMKTNSSGGTASYPDTLYRVRTDGLKEILLPDGAALVDDGSGQKVYRVLSDALGSSALVLDSSARPTQGAQYGAFGGLDSYWTHDADTSDGTIPYETDLLFNGKESSGLVAGALDVYDFGARSYAADLGVWLSVDPSMRDDLNPYAFVSNSPASFADDGGAASKYAAYRKIMERDFGEMLELGWEIMGPDEYDVIMASAGMGFSMVDGPFLFADAIAVDAVAVGMVGKRVWRAAQRSDKIFKYVEYYASAGRETLRHHLAAEFGDLSAMVAHHVVPIKQAGFETARWILVKAEIDINDIVNGAALPVSMHPSSLHTNLNYIEDVNSLLVEGYQRNGVAGVYEALDEIRHRLYEGRYLDIDEP